MRAMMLHFALGASLIGGMGKPMAYRYPTDPETLKKGRTVVEVENTGFNDAVVYAVQGLRVQRLGTVTGLTVSTFTIPRDFTASGAQLRFGVHQIGGRNDQLSDEITVDTGAKVNLWIPPF